MVVPVLEMRDWSVLGKKEKKINSEFQSGPLSSEKFCALLQLHLVGRQDP